MQGFIRLRLQSKILYYAMGLEEENFCSTLCFVELTVYLTAIRSANIPAAYSYGDTFSCLVYLTYAHAL